jgi:hypothetical protein
VPVAATFVDDLKSAAAVVAALTIVGGATVAAVRRYQTVFGRRRALRAKLSKLASTVRVAYVEALIGPSRFRRSLGPGLVEDVFVTDYAYVQTFSDGDGTTLVLAVTTTDRRLHPRFALGLSGSIPSDEVVLGRTRFADVKLEPVTRRAWRGARRYGYREEFYLGNPGGYQTYVLGHEQSGLSGAGMLGDLGSIPLTSGEGSLGVPPSTSPAIEEFRRRTVINTFAVTAPMYSGDSLESLQIGSDVDLVRVLPLRGLRRWLNDRRARCEAAKWASHAAKTGPAAPTRGSS